VSGEYAIVVDGASEEIGEGHGWFMGKGGRKVFAAGLFEPDYEHVVTNLVGGDTLADGADELDKAVGGAVLS
jgi:hypothetical protein